MRYYRVSRKSNRSYYVAEPKPFPADLMAHVLSDHDPETMMTYPIKYGTKAGDILGVGAWSERMIAVLNECNAGGYATHQINVVYNDEPVSGYRGIRITGRGGPFDEQRSNAVRDGRRLVRYDAMYMDESQWDGSDVFSIPGLGINIFVVERVAEELQKINLRNVKVVPHDQCQSFLR